MTHAAFASSVSPDAPSRRLEVWWWLAATVLVWLGIWAAGLPAPHVDDLFFTGTGVSLAKGHGLRNPWIATWLAQFGTDRFYAQPPLQPAALGLWLRIWGISTRSILGFQDFAGALACLAAARLLRRAGCPAWAAIAGWILVAVFVLAHGLRPEAWGAACALIAGWAWWHEGLGWWAAGCLAAALAPAFHPLAAAVVVPAGIVALLGQLRRQGRAALASRLALAVAAILVVLGLVAAALDFAALDFWHVFQAHATMRTPAAGSRLATFWGALTIGREPVLLAPAAIAFIATMFVAWRTGDRRRVVDSVGLVGGTAVLGILFYAGNAPTWIWPLASGVTLVIWARIPRANKSAFGAVVMSGVTLWSTFPWIVGSVIAQREEPATYARLRAEAAAAQPTRLLVDENAARFIYDFRLPPGARDWLLNRTCEQGMLGRIAVKPPGEAWLVDERKLELYVPDSGVHAECFRLAGHRFSTWLRHPQRVRFIP